MMAESDRWTVVRRNYNGDRSYNRRECYSPPPREHHRMASRNPPVIVPIDPAPPAPFLQGSWTVRFTDLAPPPTPLPPPPLVVMAEGGVQDAHLTDLETPWEGPRLIPPPITHPYWWVTESCAILRENLRLQQIFDNCENQVAVEPTMEEALIDASTSS